MSRSRDGHSFDAAVIGGGPAGAAAASALVRRGYSTVVVEESDYREVRVGETLPPAIRPHLVSLGVWDRFVADNHLPSLGIRSAWGHNDLHDNDFIYNPYGNGWHVDRNQFDELLIRGAEGAGACVFRRATVNSCVQGQGGDWQIQISRNCEHHRFRASFVVDATGRKSVFARKQGARRIILDHLIGVIAFLGPRSTSQIPENFTLIEAAENGWWYSAVLPNTHMVVAYMTDADIYSEGRRKASNYWLKQLERTIHTRVRVESGSTDPSLRFAAANSSRLDRVSSGNWLAVGDAAMAFDPLSGHGVYKALQSALQAAEFIHQRAASNAGALEDYAATVFREFDRYQVTRTAFYSRETRWPNSAFWNRRLKLRVASAAKLSYSDDRTWPGQPLERFADR